MRNEQFYYPKKINERFNEAKLAGVVDEANAEGKWASFLCGMSVGFSLLIGEETKKIKKAKFKTNGCGYAVATADRICEKITGLKLTELHGLSGLEKEITEYFGKFPPERHHCLETCFEALQNALEKYRSARIEEWTGEKALICTCFGVSEERIESEIKKNSLETVEEVGETCHAGTGCGSCQPLIQEILDGQEEW